MTTGDRYPTFYRPYRRMATYTTIGEFEMHEVPGSYYIEEIQSAHPSDPRQYRVHVVACPYCGSIKPVEGRWDHCGGPV